MRFTKFRTLKVAVAKVHWNKIASEMKRLSELLDSEGLVFNPDDVSLTEEGIYYINPEIGMATKVALYNPKQRVHYKDFGEAAGKQGYTDEEIADHLLPYHLVRCSYLTQEEMQGWKMEYKMVQRSDNGFPCHVALTTLKRGKELEVEEFIPGLRLRICPMCLLKVNSLIEEEEERYTREDFRPSYFFDAGIETTWIKPLARSRSNGVMAHIHPRDWESVSTTRKIQAGYICENCAVDLSSPQLQKYLLIEHSDHLGDKISYVRLRCVCLACKAESAGDQELRQSDEYMHFAELRDRLLLE